MLTREKVVFKPYVKRKVRSSAPEEEIHYEERSAMEEYAGLHMYYMNETI